MGDETKLEELERGNTDPLRGPRKPSTADSVEESPDQVVQMPGPGKAAPPPSPRGDRGE